MSAPSPARAHLLRQVSEKEWQAQVVRLAELHGWWAYHPYDSRRSTPGWLDLTLIRPPRFVVAELKTEAGRVSRAQWTVIDLLAECPGVEVFVWRPSDWPEVERTLARPRRVR